MSRYLLTIEYDGTNYYGWQRQKHGPSVQAALEEACARLDGTAPTVYGAGRTDAGVHARGQRAHVDLAKNLHSDKVRDGLNHHLGNHAISVLAARIVPDDFNARFDAISRSYLYRIIDRRPRLALDKNRIWRIPQTMDADLMHYAAGVFLGQHDFTTFRDRQCQAKSPVKTLDELSVRRIGAEIHIKAKARSFLHKQIRSIVGTLAEVGTGKMLAKDVERALKAKDRKMCGPVAPAHGLYLMDVEYEKHS